MTFPGSVEIDLRDAMSKPELHRILAQALNFPPYYGNNWDAFWDVINDVELPSQIRVLGLTQIEQRLPVDAAQLRTAFEQLSRESPSRSPQVTYEG